MAHLKAGHIQPLWEVVRDTIRDFLFWHPEWTMERMAEALEVHPSTLYAYTEPPQAENGSGRAIPAPRLIRLAEITQDDRLARHVLSRFQQSGLLKNVMLGEPERLDFQGATVEGEDFSGKDLRGLVADGKTKFIHCNFSAALMNDARAPKSTFVECNFFRTRMLGANMNSSTHIESNFTEANLTDVGMRHASVIESLFRDCTHSCLDMRDVKFTNTQWFADRYRGGRMLEGARVSGLVGISESHFIVGEIIRRQGAGRQKFDMLAGWIWAKFLGCWQSLFNLMEMVFTLSEREEIFTCLRAEESWLVGIRLEYEFWKRERLITHWGEDRAQWPQRSRERDKPLIGQACTVAGISGRVSSAGLFRPDVAEQERYDTMDVTTDEMLHLALALSQRKV